MTDRIELHDMRFMGRHGVLEKEQVAAQPFAVDVELVLDLRPAGVEDALAMTVDYGSVFEVCRRIVEKKSFRLIEALADAISGEILGTYPADEVVVRVRKLNPPIDGTLAWAGVEIRRPRSDPGRTRT